MSGGMVVCRCELAAQLLMGPLMGMWGTNQRDCNVMNFWIQLSCHYSINGCWWAEEPALILNRACRFSHDSQLPGPR